MAAHARAVSHTLSFTITRVVVDNVHPLLFTMVSKFGLVLRHLALIAILYGPATVTAKPKQVAMPYSQL